MPASIRNACTVRPETATVVVVTDKPQRAKVQPDLQDSTKRTYDQAHDETLSERVRKESITDDHTPEYDDIQTARPHDISLVKSNPTELPRAQEEK
ncbi:hypothetical protein KIN20_010998 [Parelaphostrongylus tenuis]|uniref:Uncharacterized protein n=1 Tax=Parelaphostrongylus tenuis TaxID=148309 RepID=A0AAD5QPJ3_PARTN|nr:hypothetical protein KIN20_010998 [Parelaphostrongylus tenuis]